MAQQALQDCTRHPVFDGINREPVTAGMRGNALVCNTCDPLKPPKNLSCGLFPQWIAKGIEENVLIMFGRLAAPILNVRVQMLTRHLAKWYLAFFCTLATNVDHTSVPVNITEQ